MGFKQRERRRKRKAAMEVARAQSKRERSAASAGKWWLTPVSTTTCCAVCGGVLRKGREMVYRHSPREARCVACAEGLSYRPSVQWERDRRGKMDASRRLR